MVKALDGLRVLLAEDNPTNQIVAVQMLESLGAEVALAEDGAQALELAAARPFDVGLIDIEMPRVSGTEVIRRMREGPPEWRAMPLIALTAYVMMEHREALDEAGADGVIAKPILSIEQLGADIREIMARRRAPARAPAAPDRPGVPGIDPAACDMLADSIGAEAMADLLAKVDADLSTMSTRLEGAVKRADTATVREVTHSLGSVAGIVGAARLQQLSGCLNSAAHAGDNAEIARLGAEVISGIRDALSFVRTRAKE